MSKRAEVPSEEYMQDGVGPVLSVSEDRAGVRIALEVGYWGIMQRLDFGELARLHKQLGEIIAAQTADFERRKK